MAIDIDPENLSADDIWYIEQRTNLQRDLELILGKSWDKIKEELGEPSEPEDDENEPDEETSDDDSEEAGDDEDSDEGDGYEEWEYADLVAEVKARELHSEGRKSEDLIATLRADDEASE